MAARATQLKSLTHDNEDAAEIAAADLAKEHQGRNPRWMKGRPSMAGAFSGKMTVRMDPTEDPQKSVRVCGSFSRVETLLHSDEMEEACRLVEEYFNMGCGEVIYLQLMPGVPQISVTRKDDTPLIIRPASTD